MNGHDTHDFFPEYDWRADDEDQRTDIECPFCRAPVVWQIGTFYCLNCEFQWNATDEIEADRVSPEDDER